MATLLSLTQNVREALITTGTPPLFSKTTCFYAFDPESSLKNVMADKFCVIQPTGLRVIEKSWAGSNVINYITQFVCLVNIYVRLGTDEAHRDTNYLLDTVYGSLTLADSVIDVFQIYTATDGETVYGYEIESVKFPENKDRSAVGWSRIMIVVKSDLQGR